MHYKNGRQVMIGDWVVGVSHNSQNKPICGLVVELMPDQGTCNIKIHIWEDQHFTEEGHPAMIPATESKGRDDYGNANEFIRVDDGLRMVLAVEGWGKYGAPYLCLNEP
jgi:hypothetical protein